jgi:glycoside/pentoside/hexuronide:cation symporter, GPH family
MLMKKDEPRLALKEKVSWGLGGFSEQLAVNGLNNLFIPIYNIGLGLDSVLIGWAMSIPRFFDMISDPIIGNMSDNCRSRFGRRRPYVLWGGLLMALVLGIAYMASPFWGTWTLFGYAVVTCILFYLMYTVFQVPYTALGLELTDDYDERADVQKYRMIFASVATFTIPWLYKLCMMVGETLRAGFLREEAPWYLQPFRPLAGLAANEAIKDEVLGVRLVAWGLALIVFLTVLPAFFWTRGKVSALAQQKIGLLRSAKMVGGNRSFLILCAMIFLVITGMFFVNPLLVYVNIFYVFGGDKSTASTWTGLYGSVSGIASLAGSFLVPVLVRLFDKKKVQMGGVLLGAIAVLSTWFAVRPERPAFQLIPAVFIGFGMSACWLLNGAFIADICDEDELSGGHRREGMFSAVFGFAVKMAFTMISLLMGYMLSLIGYKAGADSMSPQTVLRLRLFLALFPSACMIGAVVVFSRYALTRRRVQEIQAELTRRRGQVDSQSISGIES